MTADEMTVIDKALRVTIGVDRADLPTVVQVADDLVVVVDLELTRPHTGQASPQDSRGLTRQPGGSLSEFGIVVTPLVRS